MVGESSEERENKRETEGQVTEEREAGGSFEVIDNKGQTE